MKNKISLVNLALLLFMLGACVDDYTDSNPAHKKDAPTLRLAETPTSSLVQIPGTNQYQYGYEAYVTYAQPSVFEVSIIDAPGKIGAATATFSIPDFGTASIDEASFNAVKGKETGTFKVIFTPNPDLEDESDRRGSFVVTVTDTQLDDKGQAEPLTTTLSFPVNVVACINTGIEGDYVVTASDGNIDGGDTYTLTDLTDILEHDVEVTITEVHPGRYTLSDATGGVWPAVYSGRAAAKVQVDYCGDYFAGHPGALTAGSGAGPLRTFTVDGELNDDGTITVTWSYVREDAPTPANPAKGVFTLTKVE